MMKTTKRPDRSSHRSTSTVPGIGSDKGIPGSRACKAAAKGADGSRALKGISDRQLLSGIRKLSETERETVLSILVHLVEIERRRLYLERGYSSLFEFCTVHLKYSESTAGRRIRAARSLRDFPDIYGLLASGRIALSNVVKISGIITSENSVELLCRIEGRSAREVDLIVSMQNPRSAVRDRVRPVYVKTEILVPVDDTGSREAAGSGSGKKSTVNVDGKKLTSPGNTGSADGPGRGKGSSVEPATERRVVLEQRYKIEFGADQDFLDKLERVRSLLSTKHHRRLEFSELFEILLDEHIERHSPEARARRKKVRERKKACTASAGTGKREPGRKILPQPRQRRPERTGRQEASRYIPRSVRDKVYERDGGRCAFVSSAGRRCRSKWDLQIDHIVPFARGGDNSAGNLRLLCGKHNRLEAKRAFGQKHMERFVKEQLGWYCLRSGIVIRDLCIGTHTDHASEGKIPLSVKTCIYVQYFADNRPHFMQSFTDGGRSLRAADR